jgi:hypothetical protein
MHGTRGAAAVRNCTQKRRQGPRVHPQIAVRQDLTGPVHKPVRGEKDTRANRLRPSKTSVRLLVHASPPYSLRRTDRRREPLKFLMMGAARHEEGVRNG